MLYPILHTLANLDIIHLFHCFNLADKKLWCFLVALICVALLTGEVQHLFRVYSDFFVTVHKFVSFSKQKSFHNDLSMTCLDLSLSEPTKKDPSGLLEIGNVPHCSP